MLLPGPAGERGPGLGLRVATIALAVLGIYSPVIDPYHPPEWLWDDDVLLTKNATVQHRLSDDPSAPPAHLETLARIWLAPDGIDYFPMTSTVLWAQWPFFSMDPQTRGPVAAGGPAVAWPVGYHLTNVLLHILGALSVWRLLAVMKLPGAWLGGLLFAVHPVCVESVAWVSELKNTLSLPLFALAASEFVRADEIAETGVRPPRALGNHLEAHFLLSIVLFLLAMLAKPSMVAFPVVILLHTWWKRNAVTAGDLARALPFFVISLVMGLVTIGFQHGRALGEEVILVGGLGSRVATAGMGILWYLFLICWPARLLPIYPKWEVDPPHAVQFLPWLVVALVGAWCWRHRATWGRHVLFGLGFFLSMVAPVLGFVTMSYMRISWVADHFIYLPMVGIVALAAAGVARCHERATTVGRRRIALSGAAVLGLLAWLSFGYARLWVNEDALWTYTLQKNDGAWQAHNRLGTRKLARRQVEDVEPVRRIQDLGAMHHFLRATALRPDLCETNHNVGAAWMMRAEAAKRRGDRAAFDRCVDQAIEVFSVASKLPPPGNAAQKNLAFLLSVKRRYEEAAIELRHLLEVHPDDPTLLNNLGATLYESGKTDEAIEHYRKALQIAPGLQDARKNLAVALGKARQPAGEARAWPADAPAASAPD